MKVKADRDEVYMLGYIYKGNLFKDISALHMISLLNQFTVGFNQCSSFLLPF